MKTTWQEEEHPSQGVRVGGSRQDSGTDPPFLDHSPEAFGEEIRILREKRMHPLGCNILPGCCKAGPQPMPPGGLPLLQASPTTPSSASLGPALLNVSSAGSLWGQAGVGMREILLPPASWPCWLWVTHPGWEPKPRCSPTPFLAGLLQELPLCRGIQPAWEGCNQRGEWRARGMPGPSVHTVWPTAPGCNWGHYCTFALAGHPARRETAATFLSCSSSCWYSCKVSQS